MPDQPFPQRSYTPLLIASVPRSGTNLLRSLLNNHPDILVHGESLNSSEAARLTAPLWEDRPRIPYTSGTYRRYLEDHIFPADPGNVRVVGFKIFPLHFAHAPEGRKEAEELITGIPGLKVILLERYNLLDLAISEAMARRNNVWVIYNEQQAPQERPLDLPPGAILERMKFISKQRINMRRIVEHCDVRRVTYKDLVHRTDDVMRDLQAWLGVDIRSLQPNSFIRKQRIVARREALLNFDAERALCAEHHPEWLTYFDAPEDHLELPHTPRSQQFSVVRRTKPAFTPDYSPEKFPAFYLQLFHDAELAEYTLKRLRTAYPRSPVLLQSDGDDDPSYERLAQAYGCTYFRGERLYTVENGGRMLQRMLNDYLAGFGDWLVKIDTDTRIDRPFRYFPRDDVIAGSLLCQGPPQGGCVIIPREAAARIRDSRVLLNPHLRQPLDTWGKKMTLSFLRERLANTGCIGFEWTLYWACAQLNIDIVQHPEIHATWKQGHANIDRRFAAVHPDKFLNIDNASIHDLCTSSHEGMSRIWLEAIYRSG